jgi:hypothetical protein
MAIVVREWGGGGSDHGAVQADRECVGFLEVSQQKESLA